MNRSIVRDGSSECVVVVFVHGTIFSYPSFENIKKLFRDNSDEKSFLGRYRKNVRCTGIYKSQPIDRLGLAAIDLEGKKKLFGVKKLIANKYKNIYQKILGDRPCNLNFYTFGWSGRLSRGARKKAACDLYGQLSQELAYLRKKYAIKDIKVEVIAHSHGGNVALNLAMAEEKFQQSFCIDKLIMLGTPIQSETSCFVESSVFKKIYNIYSLGDYIQMLDIISTQDDISKRRFVYDSKFSKLTQLEVEINNIKPHHNELWFWGQRSNFLYRKRFPIYPYPVAVFVPAITHSVESCSTYTNDLFLHMKNKEHGIKFDLYDRKSRERVNKLFFK